MGSKGQSSQQQATQQSQTYAPNAQAQGYIQDALGRASATANSPFAIPQAPVAGFSQDQQQAFQGYRDAQGAAQPYYAQAANYFSPQGTQDFYNPYAANVMANMKDLFGEQTSQNDAGLVKAAGGVGADRIAVGHAALAKQQDLSAGQTMADLWQRAGAQAQSAGQGQMQLGNADQASRLQDAHALFGAGQQQQQLQQQQMNSPYQQAVAQAAFPYQQSQFYASLVGALAPGLGGTTSGFGTSNGTATPAQPSVWSQLLGAGVAGAGIYGGLGGFGGISSMMGSPSYGGDGTWGSGNGVYGGSASNPLPGLSRDDYAATGGRINPYAEGGAVDEPEGPRFGAPIDISSHSFIPQAQLTPIQPHIPQLDLTPPKMQEAKQPGGIMGSGVSAGDVAKMAMMFANRGGRVNPYAEGGAVFDDRYSGETKASPWEFVKAGAQDFATDARKMVTGDRSGTTFDNRKALFDRDRRNRYAEGGATDDEPFRMPGQAAMDAWRKGVAEDMGAGAVATPYDGGTPVALPKEITGPPTEEPAMALAAADGATPRPRAALKQQVAEGPAQGVDPFTLAVPQRERGFSDSPWAAVTAAGLGMMAGTSPFAGVNIGTGGQQGLKALETQREAAQKDQTIDMAARRLMLEARHHEDQYNRLTAGQKETSKNAQLPYEKMTKAEEEAAAAKNFGWQVNENGTITAIKGGPHDPETIRAAAEAKSSGGLSDAAVEVMARQGAAGDQSWSKNIGRGNQGSRDLGRVRNRMADILTQEQGKSPDQAAQFISNAQKEWSASQIAANAGARTRGNRVANLEMILEVADAAVPAALEASQKVNRTGWVQLNKIIQRGQVATSNPELAEFGIANLQLAEGWARAMNPTGVMRESDRDKALEFLGTATSQETYERAVRQIQKQITREKDAISKGHSPKENTKVDPGDMPSPKAIELLNTDPAKYREDFEKRYGKGSTTRFLTAG